MRRLVRSSVALPLAMYAALSVAYLAWARLVVIKLWVFSPIAVYGLPMRFGYEGYSRWDAAWYVDIARRGYYYGGPDVQSSVAYFPGYPATMRVVGKVLPDLVQAGMAITFVAGAAFVAAVHSWTRRLFDERVAVTTAVILLLWPYAYYLFGVVYSDALFLALAVLAFVALERRHPWLAAIVGAAAVGTRPVGVALVVGLVIRSLEIDGVVRARPRFALDARNLRISTLAPAASAAGLATYCAYLWYRFRDPLAFTKVGGAEGWHRGLHVSTILKDGYVDVVRRGELTVELLTLSMSAVLTVIALGLVVRVYRRLGPGYAAYSAIAVLLPVLTSPEFRGMGRYVLAAFPCFAVSAEWIVQRGLRRAAIVVGALVMFLVLGLFATYFIRGYYMA